MLKTLRMPIGLRAVLWSGTDKECIGHRNASGWFLDVWVIEMAEIGEPERRRILVPDDFPAESPPTIVPERRTDPIKVPEKEPA